MEDVVKTMPFLPPMSGNGLYTTYKHADDGHEILLPRVQ
jgi:hypothetical protein